LPIAAGLLVHLTAGPVFDYVRSRNICSVTVVRKVFQSIGTIIPAAFMFAVCQLDSSIYGKYLIMTLITVGYAVDEVAVMAGFSFCLLDIASDFVGTLQGIKGTIGFTSGFIIPMIVAALTPEVSIIDNLVKLWLKRD